MTIKKLFRLSFVFTVVCLVMPSMPFGIQASLLSAQTATTQTVLTTAIADGNTTVWQVASVSGDCGTASTGTIEYDAWTDGELAKIQAVNGTTLTVSRGKTGRATAHPNGSVVFCGQAGRAGPFIGGSLIGGNPNPGSSCTSTSFPRLPLINTGGDPVEIGTIWNCLAAVSAVNGSNAGSRWIAYNYKQWTIGHPVINISDAAYTATLADEFINYINLTTGRTVTLPAITGIIGKVIVIKNSVANGSTITIAASANQGVGTIGGTTQALTGPAQGGVTRLISVATSAGGWSWATW